MDEDQRLTMYSPACRHSVPVSPDYARLIIASYGLDDMTVTARCARLRQGFRIESTEDGPDVRTLVDEAHDGRHAV